MTYSYKDKVNNLATLNGYMLNKTLGMFEYEGLPETIPAKELEKLLQKHGYAFITSHKNKLYAFVGGLGGVQDVYGNPTEIVVANPALGLNKTFNLENDGVLIRNDDLGLGLMPLFDRYNSMIVENDINMVLYGYSTRLTTLLSASDDATKASAERVISKIVDGELSVAGENPIFDGIRVHNSGSQGSQAVAGLIELGQFLKAALNNEVGISGNTNLKRERLLGAEVEQNEDSIFSLAYAMGKARFCGVEKLNAKYGLKVAVDFGSVWKDKDKTLVDGKVNKDVKENDNSGTSTSANSKTSANSTQEQLDEINAMLEDATLSS
jgi:hypothetical protein